MRKITEKAVNAFERAEKFRMGNTEVEVLPNVTILKLHDNNIAYKYNDPENTLSISTCGFNSKTTKERLNAIRGVNIKTKKGNLYLNGVKWDGNLIDIKR